MKHEVAQREFDVFYSYSNKDQDWVNDKLVKELEEKHHFKGLMDSRDFIGGLSVVRNVERAVKRSKKTIAVLTPSYVDSKWCQYEAVHAMTTAMNDRLDAFLIPIMLEQCDVPEYMRNITYIDVHDEHFWKKLVDALNTHTFTFSETINTA